MYKDIEHIYQQWCSGNANFANDWFEFVKLAANYQCTTIETMQKMLQTQRWFKCGD